MYKHIVYTIIMAIFIIGCSKPVEEEPVEEAAPPPPPPTPQEIANKIINDLKLDAPLPPATQPIDPAELQALTSTLQSAQAQQSATEDGKVALQHVSQKIDSKVRQAYSNEHWTYVVAYNQLHTMLNPGSTKYISELTMATAELSRPQVTIKGIINDGQTGSRSAYLDIYLPLEGVTHQESMKQGDQLYGIRFVEIIGNNQGIIFEYMETGDSFEVLTKAASN